MNTSISPLEDEIKTLEPKVLELFEESKRIAGLLNNEIPVDLSSPSPKKNII